jgi:hypothetical protein
VEFNPNSSRFKSVPPTFFQTIQEFGDGTYFFSD